MPNIKWLKGVAVALVLLATAACKPSHERETAPVRGVVKLDGKPLPSGYVFLSPPSGRMAKGAIQEDGSFVLGTYHADDGAQVGKHPVVVAPLPGDERRGIAPERIVNIPPKYSAAATSGLTIDVKSGEENEATLELSSSEK